LIEIKAGRKLQACFDWFCHEPMADFSSIANLNQREFLMSKWIGAAGVAVALMVAGAGRIESAAAAPLQEAVQASQASKPTDVRAHRRYHRYSYRRYDRPYDPYYYARPTYYAPNPDYVPFPFGLGFGPWW
jgi:hypothetical protein